MEPNACPHCHRTLTDREVIRMYKRYCAGQRKPKLAGILKQEPLTEADRQWGRDEVKRISALKSANSAPKSEQTNKELFYDYGEGQS